MRHSYPWYIADWRMSEARLVLNAEERAIYRELLDELYRNGTLTNDPLLLYRICAVSQQEWDRSWPKVRKFFIREGRYLINKKASQVIEKLGGFEDTRRAAAKTAAHARWNKPSDASRMPEAMPQNAHPQPLPLPLPRPLPATSSVTDLAIRESVERLYAAHPKKSNLVLIPGALIAAVNGAPDVAGKLAAIEKCHASWCATDEWKERNGRFAPKLDVWLADRGYSAWPGGVSPDDYDDPKRYEHGE